MGFASSDEAGPCLGEPVFAGDTTWDRVTSRVTSLDSSLGELLVSISSEGQDSTHLPGDR